jgi:MFS family permease
MTSDISQSQVDRARWAVYLAFISNGFAWGAFIPRIPDVKEQFDLSNSQLGTTLFIGAIGILIAMKPAGALTARWGSARTIRVFTVLLAIDIVLLGALFSYVWLLGTLFLLGVIIAGHDIAMNVHGTSVENASGRSLMNGFHARFSLGSLGGALVGGLCAQIHLEIWIQMLGVAVFLIACLPWISPRLLPSSYDQSDDEKIAHEDRKRPSVFYALGLLGFFASVCEGSASDWGAVLLRETWNASPFISTVPYVVFTIAMVVGRFRGDRVTDKYNRELVVRWGGLTAGIGLIVGLLVGRPIGVSLGWLLLGVGVSIAIPSVFSASVEIANHSFVGQVSASAAVAIVGAVSYAGFLLGPPLIGWLADVVTLRWAMLLPAFLALAMGLSARIVRA